MIESGAIRKVHGIASRRPRLVQACGRLAAHQQTTVHHHLTAAVRQRRQALVRQWHYVVQRETPDGAGLSAREVPATSAELHQNSGIPPVPELEHI